MKHIFVYGSLMFDDVWKRIINLPYIKVEGRIIGYKTFIIRNQRYPGLVRSRGSTVNGKLILNVKHSDITTLDRYEGDCYLRAPVNVFVQDDSYNYSAQTYLFRSRCYHLLSNRRWHPEYFRLANVFSELW